MPIWFYGVPSVAIARCYDVYVDPRFSDKIQLLVDEYVGAMGSAAIVSRTGDLMFQSTLDDSAYALAPIMRRLPREAFDTLTPEVLSLTVDESSCGYAVALGDDHVLLVVTDFGIAHAEAARRVKNAARVLSLALRARVSTPPDNGASGAPAEIAARTAPRS